MVVFRPRQCDRRGVGQLHNLHMAVWVFTLPRCDYPLVPALGCVRHLVVAVGLCMFPAPSHECVAACTLWLWLWGGVCSLNLHMSVWLYVPFGCGCVRVCPRNLHLCVCVAVCAIWSWLCDWLAVCTILWWPHGCVCVCVCVSLGPASGCTTVCTTCTRRCVCW